MSQFPVGTRVRVTTPAPTQYHPETSTGTVAEGGPLSAAESEGYLYIQYDVPFSVPVMEKPVTHAYIRVAYLETI